MFNKHLLARLFVCYSLLRICVNEPRRTAETCETITLSFIDRHTTSPDSISDKGTFVQRKEWDDEFMILPVTISVRDFLNYRVVIALNWIYLIHDAFQINILFGLWDRRRSRGGSMRWGKECHRSIHKYYRPNIIIIITVSLFAIIYVLIIIISSSK